MVIAYHGGRLIYGNLYGDKDSDGRYGEGVVSVILKEFQMHAVHISGDVQGSDRRIHHAWILPACFNRVLHRIFGTWNVIVLYCAILELQPNVEFVQKLFLNGSSDLK